MEELENDSKINPARRSKDDNAAGGVYQTCAGIEGGAEEEDKVIEWEDLRLSIAGGLNCRMLARNASLIGETSYVDSNMPGSHNPKAEANSASVFASDFTNKIKSTRRCEAQTPKPAHY